METGLPLPRESKTFVSIRNYLICRVTSRFEIKRVTLRPTFYSTYVRVHPIQPFLKSPTFQEGFKQMFNNNLIVFKV